MNTGTGGTPDSFACMNIEQVHAREELAITILWSPLLPLTWIFPFIGHMGIADSRGVSSDFQGSYHVGDRGRMAFGNPTRALTMDISQLPGGKERWDAMILEANEIYRARVHNLVFDNCHSHVACALNSMGIKVYGVGMGKWNMVKLCFLVFFRARFLSVKGFLVQFLPSIVFICALLR
mmetsp:Transcript_14879/g.21297  ORF Transcript_14879/g.21297 Transcript_14879/m.21297 type:complete len:179 (+) Transcript_14879:254-790(+)